MTKTVRKKTTRTIKKTFTSPFNIYWKKNNYLLLLAGVVIIIAGFWFMSLGSWDSFTSLVISPLLLFMGYILVFPASIFYRKKKEASEDATTHSNI